MAVDYRIWRMDKHRHSVARASESPPTRATLSNAHRCARVVTTARRTLHYPHRCADSIGTTVKSVKAATTGTERLPPPPDATTTH